MTKKFTYEDMIKRNIGILTMEDQDILKDSTVAIAGCGGAGGEAAIMLARMGVGHIKLSDPDTYDISNLNRQYGAKVSTLGKNKAETIASEIQDINPFCKVTVLNKGVDEGNISNFLEGSNIAVDEIDFNQPYFTALFHRRARALSIPVVSGVDVLWGSFLLFFFPESLSYEEYVGKSKDTNLEEFRNFSNPISAYAPELPAYLDASVLTNVAEGKIDIPVVAPSVSLNAGILSAFVCFSLTNMREIKPVPYYYFTQDMLVLEPKLNTNMEY
jgi:molybdopterin/thiamine biosynthesis adenylyltransferase